MLYKIQIFRQWSCAPFGGPPVSYEAGVYSVPEDMGEDIAGRILRSGRGKIASNDASRVKPRTAPENKRRVQVEVKKEIRDGSV